MKQAVMVSLVSLMLASSLPVWAAKVGGVDVPDTYALDNMELELNGAGTRSKLFIDVYVGSLYLPQPQQDASTVINANEPQAITLHVTSGLITSERMTEATMEGFEASTGGNMSPIQADIDEFMSVFKEKIREGDVFGLVYVPEEGVRVLKNGEHKDTVGDLEFKKALFGIWLSDEPAQKGLKTDMMGG